MLLAGKHIFVVEDDPTNLAIISTILRQHGATVSFDPWGSATLDKIEIIKKEIDLIVLDLMFQDQVTGYDIFDAMQAVPELAHIPIVLVTSSDPDIEMNKARAKKFSGYISKPINRMRFPKQIAAILEGQEVWEDDIE